MNEYRLPDKVIISYQTWLSLLMFISKKLEEHPYKTYIKTYKENPSIFQKDGIVYENIDKLSIISKEEGKEEFI